MSFLHRAQKQGRKYRNPVPTTVGGLAMGLRVLPQLLFNKAQTVPRVQPGPFRTDPARFAAAPPGGVRVTWFGHSSSLLELDGVNLLLDPVWDLRAAPVQWAGPKRFFSPTIPLDQLPRLDAVLLSHDHYDHLGAGTVRTLTAARPGLRWVTSLGVGAELRKLGVPQASITELDWTEETQVQAPGGAQAQIRSLPARHFSGRSVSNRFETLWASFARRRSRHAELFGADTGLWEGFTEIGQTYGPFDLTMLEIGAFNELWAGIHLGPDGAAEAFRRMGGGGLLMPIHWGLFNLALHAWTQPIERMHALAQAGGLKLFSPEPGRPEEPHELLSGWWQQG